MSSTASAARIAADTARRAESSVARVEANRRNGLKSTGPRTPEGKARVSENALKHGLRSERNPLDLATDTALPFEREEFVATLDGFMADLAPQGPLETRLVERLAQIDLRLNRAVRMETTHLEMHTTMLTLSMAGALPPGEQTQHAWLTTLAFLKNPSATTLIAQYESRLALDFARTLAQLRQAQKLREQTQRHPAQESREKTQSAAMPNQRSHADPSTTQRSHPSDGVVAPDSPDPSRVENQAPNPAAPTQESAKQTQQCADYKQPNN